MINVFKFIDNVRPSKDKQKAEQSKRYQRRKNREVKRLKKKWKKRGGRERNRRNGRDWRSRGISLTVGCRTMFIDSYWWFYLLELFFRAPSRFVLSICLSYSFLSTKLHTEQ